MATNTAASVRQKLLNKSRDEKRPFQELLQYYAMERFLYRLSQSPHSGCFILKGALMIWAMQGPTGRPTRDIDMLGQTNNEPEAILDQVQEIIAAEVLDDGLHFDPDTLKAETITEDADKLFALSNALEARLGSFTPGWEHFLRSAKTFLSWSWSLRLVVENGLPEFPGFRIEEHPNAPLIIRVFC